MIDFYYLMKGIIIGFCIAAPVGPIGLLCIQKTLHFGRLSGFFSGLGAAAADTFYGAIAAFGLQLVATFFLSGRWALHLIGGTVLVILGLKILFTKGNGKEREVTHKTLLGDFVSTFFLTLANPLTIIAFLAIFAGIGLSGRHIDGAILILGVFIGSASWWLLLSEGITLFRGKISQRLMRWFNRIAGLLIIALGIIAFSLLFQ